MTDNLHMLDLNDRDCRTEHTRMLFERMFNYLAGSEPSVAIKRRPDLTNDIETIRQELLAGDSLGYWWGTWG